MMLCLQVFLGVLSLLSVGAPAVAALRESPRTGAARVATTPRSSDGPRSYGPAREAHVRVEAATVLVPVQVTNASGAPVTGLTRADFRVYEDGAEQSVTYFATDDAPVSVGLLFDSSASMKDKKTRSAEAAAEFFNTANPDDEFFLVEFDEKPRLRVPFTSDTVALLGQIRRTHPFGRTSLFDAIHLALGEMRHARHQRRALVILSDGGDNRSRRTFSEVRRDVLESDLEIYAMGVFDREGEKPDSREEANGPGVLSGLAELTGGRLFPVKLADLPATSATISKLLRDEYLLGYSPTNATAAGKYRSIKVKLDAPMEDHVFLRFRKGYYASDH